MSIFKQIVVSSADNLFSESAISLGPIPSNDITSCWGDVFSDVYYHGTKAADVPLGGVITPFQGESWESATMLVAYQVVQITESKIICRKCYDSSNSLGLKDSSVPSISADELASLADVNAIGETATARPFLPVCPENVSLLNNCPVYAFTDWSVTSISSINNNNSFIQLCGDVGFVGTKPSLVRSSPVRADLGGSSIQVSMSQKGEKYELSATNVSAFTALALRDVSVTAKFLANVSSLNTDVIKRATQTVLQDINMSNLPYIADASLCFAFLSGNWALTKSEKKNSICLMDLASTGENFNGLVSSLYSDLKEFAKVVDKIFERSLSDPQSTYRLFQLAESALRDFTASKPINLTFQFSILIWAKLLCDWGLFLRNPTSINNPLPVFLEEQESLFKLSDKERLSNEWLSLMARVQEESSKATADIKKRKSEDDLAAPKEPKNNKKPKIKDKKGNNSNPKSLCMNYVGFLARAANSQGKMYANCKGENLPCEKYLHEAPTSSTKEGAKAGAARYFKDENTLKLVTKYIDKC